MLIYVITICVLILAVIAFVILYAITNKELKTIKSSLGDNIKLEAAYAAKLEEAERMLRSYEITVENYENLLVRVTDKLPKKRDAKSYAMKLSNELSEFFKVDEENDELSLVVYKGDL